LTRDGCFAQGPDQDCGHSNKSYVAKSGFQIARSCVLIVEWEPPAGGPPALRPEYPVQDTLAEVITTSADFENFSDDDELWLSDLETRAIDLENELSVWREVRQRAVGEPEYAAEPVPIPPHESFRRVAGRPDRGAQAGSREPVNTTARRAGGRYEPRVAGRSEPRVAGRSEPRVAGRSEPRVAGRSRVDERTRALIDHGRRSVRRGRFGRGQKIAMCVAAAVVGLTVLIVVVFRPGASWPASVAVVQNEISTACQNPNVVSEPNQVNFACGKSTSQILWVFSLMTSGDNPNFSDTKTGRQGLEPISATQGGEVAWSLNLHHPYNPYNPIDSLEVAARAINNIIGGASLTASSGKPTVQSGLESVPANCALYTGSAAVVTRVGYPDICATAVTSASGQAALVADVYKEWFVGSSPAFAQDASVLYQNATDPGNPQVQAILKTLFGSAA